MTNIVTGSVAANAGLQVGDAIFNFDGKAVTSPADLQAAVAAVKPARSFR